MTAALDGLIVLDLTNFLSGPYCTMLLGDLGADVIKVERPDGGDDARRMPPFVDGRSQPFAVWNRNKRSITADLKQPEDIELLRQLALRADVLVENFRPGTLARLGLGWEALSAANPRLIWCAISGFGQTGPWADHGGLDMMAQGMSGLMAGNGPPDGEPYRLPIAITDVTAGMFSAMSVLAAVQLGCSTGGSRVRPVVDLLGMAQRDLEPGEQLNIGVRHVIDGLQHVLRPAQPLADDAPLPYYMAAGARLTRRVRAGQPLKCGDVALDTGTALYRLRKAQDQHFLSLTVSA